MPAPRRLRQQSPAAHEARTTAPAHALQDRSRRLWPRAVRGPLEIFRAAQASLEAGRLHEAEANIRIAITFDPSRSEFKEALGSSAHPGRRRPGVEAARDAERRMSDGELRDALAAHRGRAALPAARSGAQCARRAGLPRSSASTTTPSNTPRRCSSARAEVASHHSLLGRIERARGDLTAREACLREGDRARSGRSRSTEGAGLHANCRARRGTGGTTMSSRDRNRSRDDELMRGGDRERSAHGDPERGRLQDDALDVRHLAGRQATRRPPRQAPGDHQRAQHDLRQQAPDRPALRRPGGPEVDRPVPVRDRARPERRSAHQDRRQDLHVSRDRGHRAARDEARRRGVSRARRCRRP